MHAWLHSLGVYADRRVMVVLLQGFASGLPLPLVFATLSIWLSEEGVSKTAIGLFSWVSAAYTIKFLWSPVVDHMTLPVLTRWLGRRRAWLFVSQIMVAGAMLGLGLSTPSIDPWGTALWAAALAFASATQDIVVDTYRIESLGDDLAGAGAGSTALGYRIGMMAASGGALVIADGFGWFVAYAVMAVLMGVSLIVTLFIKEPQRLVSSSPAPRLRVAFPSWFHEAVVAPFMDFARRDHWVLILLVIALYKYGDALLGNMAGVFYHEIGFTKFEIGTVSKSYGVLMTVIGGLFGGLIVVRCGVMKALLICGVAQGLSNLAFVAQAMIGPSVPALMMTISIENLTGGMGSAAFIAYLSSLTHVAYTATQYALFSSFMALARTFLASGGGWLADHVSWVSYFLISTAAAIPGLFLLAWMMHLFPRHDEQIRVSAFADD